MNKLLYTAFAAAVIAAPLVHAEGPYIGAAIAGAGSSHIEERENGTLVRYEPTRKQTQLRLFGGLDLDQQWGLETGYHGLGGRTTFDANGGKLKVRSDVFYLAGKRTWQLGEDWSLFAKAGLARSHAQMEVSNSGGAASASVSKTGAYLSAGAAWMVAKDVALQVELERIKQLHAEGLDVGLNRLSLGVRYNF